MYFDDFDGVFPVGRKARAVAGVFESCRRGVCEGGEDDDLEEDDDVFEGVMDRFAGQYSRLSAMNAILAWAQGNDCSYEAFDEIVSRLCGDMDEDDEDVSDEEAVAYSQLWSDVPEALASLGAERSDIEEFCSGPSGEADRAALRVCNAVDKYLEDSKLNDTEIANSFAFGEDAVLESIGDDGYRDIFMSACAGSGSIFPAVNEGHIYEDAYTQGGPKKKAIRGGKVVLVRKKKPGMQKWLQHLKAGENGGGKSISEIKAALKKSLKKARSKSHTASATKKRVKSLVKGNKLLHRG